MKDNLNYEKILNLLDQIIIFNEVEDLKREKESDPGQSFNIFYLKLLKNLIINGEK